MKCFVMQNQDNQITIDSRVSEVFDMLIDGKPRKDICKYGKLQNWNVTDRQIDNYISTAKEQIAKMQIDKSFQFNKTLERYELLFVKSLENEDLKTCASILEKQSKLLGLENQSAPIDNELTFVHKIVY